MRKVLTAVVAAFLTTTSMTAASVALVQTAAAKAQAAKPTEDQALEAFFNSGYAWCDAKVLSQYWNTDPGSAKVWAGEKILRGDVAVLDEVLGISYTKFRCQVAFDFDDMQDVASLWTSAGPG